MSTIEPYFLDDRVIVPEYIRKMTSDERRAEIARLEEEAKKEKSKRKQKETAAV